MVHIHKPTFSFMRIRAVLVSLAIACISFIDMPSLAHGGGLNSQGCHNEKATGGYHCHRSSKPKKAKNKKNKKDKASKASKKSKKKDEKKKKSSKKKSNKNIKHFNKKPKGFKKKKGVKNYKGVIQSCYDGDTCTTTSGEKIRLACIDAPEIGSGPAAISAKNKVTDLVVGEKVNIRRYEKDRYGRSVAEIFTPGGQSSSKALVKGGFAKVYTKYAYNCSWAK